MRKGRVYLLLLVLVLAGVLVAVFNREREREPEYGGKRLSEWVEKSYAVPLRWVSMPPGGAPMLISRGMSAIPEEADEAIGTNAIPYLLQWIKYEPASWKPRFWPSGLSVPMQGQGFQASLGW